MILAKYQTKSGKDALTIKSYSEGKASYMGEYGAGSGAIQTVRASVLSHLKTKRGWKQIESSPRWEALKSVTDPDYFAL